MSLLKIQYLYVQKPLMIIQSLCNFNQGDNFFFEFLSLQSYYNINQIVYMKSGMLKHPYLGDTRTFVLNQRNMIQNKVSSDLNPEWFKNYELFKEFEWKYCLYPESVYEDESYQFNNSKPKLNLAKKIAYSGYFVSNLKDQIITRSRNHAKFGENQILYILYTILMGWREWKEFCKRYNFKDNFYAISSEYVLLNQQGDIKLITPISSPLNIPSTAYFAPQNVPPNGETQSSWNKSISFSLGLIGAELIAMKIAQSFYQYKGTQLKFNQEQYLKWIKFSEQSISKEVYNLVLLLTDQNPWVRLKIGQFEALLGPYKKEILACKQQKLNAQLSRKSLLQYLKNKKKDSSQ